MLISRSTDGFRCLTLHKLFIGASQIVYKDTWDEQQNDKTLKCITFLGAPRRDSARREGVMWNKRHIHASALCEKYGNNIAEAKQNSPLHMKYAGYSAPPQPPSSSPSYSSRHSSRGLRRAAAFRARVYSFSLFKAPHLPRSWEHTPDPPDAINWIQMRLSGTGTAQRNSRRISNEKQKSAKQRGHATFSSS